MKTSMKLFIIMILFITALAGIYFFLKGKMQVIGTTSYNLEPVTINVSENSLTDTYSNVYSVSQNQKLSATNAENAYGTVATAQIRGNDVTFTNYTTETATTVNGKTCVENNVLAAIINGAGVQNIGYKYWQDGEYHLSGAQLAIWEFWNTWVENSGANSNGFEKGIGNSTITENGLNSEEQRKNAQQCAEGKEYSANIYFLKHLANNTYIDNQPNLILVEIVDKDGNPTEPEANIVECDDIDIFFKKSSEELVRIGEEITYTVIVQNTTEITQKNLRLKNVIPDRITFMNVVEIDGEQEIKLTENVDYIYNEETRLLKVNINEIQGIKSETITEDEMGKNLPTPQNNSKKYKITVKVEEQADGVYVRELKNVIQLQRGNNIIAIEENTKVISDVYIKTEIEPLPEVMNEKDECIIGLRIANKGLIDAEKVNISISIPQEILTSIYKINMLSETGEIERTLEGTAFNEFKNESIGIAAQESCYIQIIGTVKEVVETKQITIEGTVNDENVSWTTTIQIPLDDTELIGILDKRRLLR